MKKIVCITPIQHLKECPVILKGIKGYTLVEIPDCEYRDFGFHNDAVAIFTNPNQSRFRLDRKTLESFKSLKVIATASTGTNHIDKEYCKDKNIAVLSLTEERDVIQNITGTAEHALCLYLASVRNIVSAAKSVDAGQWTYEPFMGRQVNTLTVGVVGYGRLGTLFAQYCDGLGIKVLVFDPYKHVYHPRVRQVTCLQDLVSRCDAISLHVHVSEETKEMVNSVLLGYAKSDIVIVNTARGEIVNEEDLISFLKENPNARYATDVICNEQSGLEDSPIVKYSRSSDQVLVTPHIAGMTREGQEMAFCRAANLLELYLTDLLI